MFGMGMPEIMLILAVALVVIGPKKLPGLAKSIGRALGEFKTATRDFKRSIDIDGDLQDVRDSINDLKDIPTYDPDKGAYEREDTSKATAAEPDKTEQKSDSVDSAKPAADAKDDNKAKILIGPEVDYYALGITIYELLTGSNPFSGRNALHIMRDTIEGRVVEDLMTRSESKKMSSRIKNLIQSHA